MKICTNCGESKPLEDFQRRSRNKDGRTNLCKPCKRIYDNNHYKTNLYRKDYIRSNRVKAQDEANEYIKNYLMEHPCVDCGESDIVVLEFDHISGIKKEPVSSIKRNGLKSTIEEIKKCEVRCANCHRRKTAKQLGWKNKDMP